MRQLLPFLLAFVPASLIGQGIYSENFDALHVGDRISAQDPMHWRTWSNLPGTSEDAPVTDQFADSPAHSLAFIQTVPGSVGGPVDEVLLLGYHISGSYVLSWSMYIPGNRGAFIELLHGEDIPSADPAATISFTPFTTDTVECYADGAYITGLYPHNVWFPVTFGIDLDTRMASFSVNGTLVGTWDFATMPSGISAPNVLGAMRYSSSSGWEGSWGEYYIDDLVFQEGSVGIPEIGAARPLFIAPNPASGTVVLSTGTSVANGKLDVRDLSGRSVLERAWPSGSSSFTLPAGTLAPGTYVVRVQQKDGMLSAGRLIVLP